MGYITSEAGIREVIGSPPNAIYLKKISLLEAHSKRYLQMSHLMALSAKAIPNRIHLVATQQSKIVVVDNTKYTLEVRNVPEIVAPIRDEPCGLYVLVAGLQSKRVTRIICISMRIHRGA